MTPNEPPAVSGSPGELVDVVQPLLLTTDVTRRMLSCGRTTLFGLIRDGKIETVRLGARRMVVASSVDRFVDYLRQAAS